MGAVKTRRRIATTRAARIPDDRAVVGCALTALTALLLMLLAGTAKAEQPELVCWNVENGGGAENTSWARYRIVEGSRHSGANAARSDSSSQPPASRIAWAMVFAMGPL